MNLSTKSNLFLSIIVILSVAVGVSGSALFLMPNMDMKMGMEHGEHSEDSHSAERNKEIVAEEYNGIKNLLAEGKYKCCMKEPCFRCFSKAKNHDKELVCDCLEDVMNGKHPCGECIGEILEGEGNPLISEYFASSIAEELGQQHLGTLKQIISEKYDMPIEKQL